MHEIGWITQEMHRTTEVRRRSRAENKKIEWKAPVPLERSRRTHNTTLLKRYPDQKYVRSFLLVKPYVCCELSSTSVSFKKTRTQFKTGQILTEAIISGDNIPRAPQTRFIDSICLKGQLREGLGPEKDTGFGFWACRENAIDPVVVGSSVAYPTYPKQKLFDSNGGNTFNIRHRVLFRYLVSTHTVSRQLWRACPQGYGPRNGDRACRHVGNKCRSYTVQIKLHSIAPLHVSWVKLYND